MSSTHTGENRSNTWRRHNLTLHTYRQNTSLYNLPGLETAHTGFPSLRHFPYPCCLNALLGSRSNPGETWYVLTWWSSTGTKWRAITTHGGTTYHLPTYKGWTITHSTFCSFWSGGHAPNDSPWTDVPTQLLVSHAIKDHLSFISPIVILYLKANDVWWWQSILTPPGKTYHLPPVLHTMINGWWMDIMSHVFLEATKNPGQTEPNAMPVTQNNMFSQNCTPIHYPTFSFSIIIQTGRHQSLPYHLCPYARKDQKHADIHAAPPLGWSITTVVPLLPPWKPTVSPALDIWKQGLEFCVLEGSLLKVD